MSPADRNRANKRRGSRFEVDAMHAGRSFGLDVERTARAGAEDEGDHLVRLPAGFHIPRLHIWEAKSGALKASEFVEEAIREANHFAAHRGLDRRDVLGLAVIKRRMKSPLDSYVLTTLREMYERCP
ncbi:hypothetical protein Afil01_62350 [Actinorhabdospora filicis]|uniref:Holliday junction resolvase n=1 Tax=Actinorhabdospora filicis TaxID=1785913 RepID=A0A9W6WCU1_9ACTN|nr:hypothetical protein [Actinorhabdospora filicis]GLZ81428.1 hypothetical protein Afil01_62350 [Actinorhabdospora filicis]